MANPFNAKHPAVAAEAFTFAGTQYVAGAPFPHRDLGISPLELDGLWRTGRIRFVETSSAVSALPPADRPAPAPARPQAKHYDRRPRR